MFKRSVLSCIALALLSPGAALGATMTASTSTVGLGTTVIDLTLDPEGVRTGAWLVVLGGSGIAIDGISVVTPVGTDCTGLTAASSFDAQCASLPLTSAGLVAQVTLTASAIGGTLSLVNGNITDFDSFLDVPFSPGTLVTAVPEPRTALLFAMAWVLFSMCASFRGSGVPFSGSFLATAREERRPETF